MSRMWTFAGSPSPRARDVQERAAAARPRRGGRRWRRATSRKRLSGPRVRGSASSAAPPRPARPPAAPDADREVVLDGVERPDLEPVADAARGTRRRRACRRGRRGARRRGARRRRGPRCPRRAPRRARRPPGAATVVVAAAAPRDERALAPPPRPARRRSTTRAAAAPRAAARARPRRPGGRRRARGRTPHVAGPDHAPLTFAGACDADRLPLADGHVARRRASPRRRARRSAARPPTRAGAGRARRWVLAGPRASSTLNRRPSTTATRRALTTRGQSTDEINRSRRRVDIPGCDAPRSSSPLLLLALAPAAAEAAQTGPCLPGGDGPRCTVWTAKVIHVHDGDTIEVALAAGGVQLIRLTGIQRDGA